MKLHLGVNDVPEFEGDIGVYDVASILEKNYGLFSKFAEINHDFIEAQLVKSLNSQLNKLKAGQPIKEPFQAGVEIIENQFQEFLSVEGLAGKELNPGKYPVPTMMAQKNKSRIKGAKRRGRSFVDTGTLRTHLRVWMTP